ncbi:hypothetical protein AALA80_12075 [Oscillospiraceae bacterium 50-60]
MKKISGARLYLAVRRIICKGCGRIFYAQISTKKYRYYGLCGNRGQKDLKQRRLENGRIGFARDAEKHSRPSGRMRSTAATPAANGLTVKALRIRQVPKLNTCLRPCLKKGGMPNGERFFANQGKFLQAG